MLAGFHWARHVITLAVRLIVLAILVAVGYWAWQHRGDLLDAAEPYLGDLRDRLREMDLPDLPGLSGDADGPTVSGHGRQVARCGCSTDRR